MERCRRSLVHPPGRMLLDTDGDRLPNAVGQCDQLTRMSSRRDSRMAGFSINQ